MTTDAGPSSGTPALISALRAEIARAPLSELPSIRGELARIEAELLARLLTPATPPAEPYEEPEKGDERLLTVDEAAVRLNQKPQWIRAHQDELHAVKIGRTVRFSAKKIATIIARRMSG